MVVVSIDPINDTPNQDQRDDCVGTSQWVFGPGTHHPWPGGDYCIQGHYIARAWLTYHELVEVQDQYQYRVSDPDYSVDIGL